MAEELDFGMIIGLVISLSRAIFPDFLHWLVTKMLVNENQDICPDLKRPLYDRTVWASQTASLTRHLNRNICILDEDLSKCIWKVGCPKKINFFNWNLSIGGLNTTETIQRCNRALSFSHY